MAGTRSAKRFFLGRRMATEQLGETLLPKRLALPVFASDALSSNAYATQEILLVLSLGGFAFFSYSPYIAAGVVLVYAVVVMSYRQNVHAYPSGGGDYEVVTTNLGKKAGVLTACALLVDYILTVAVSISSAVANISSAAPWLVPHTVGIAIALLVVLSLMNLRGVRESGTAFALPTYLFVFSIFAMLIYAIIRFAAGQEVRAESAGWEIVPEVAPTGFALLFLVARAFSSGTTALTGVEAISNGVPMFQEPKSRNAATTLLLLGAISMTMFCGITWLALATDVKVAASDANLIGLPAGQEQKTVIAQIAQAVFSDFPIGAFIVSIVTALILVLAANTAFNGFPVLGSILAADGFLPRQLRNRGDRLAFSNGIVMLAAAAGALIVAFDADVSKIIQLYIVGVFLSFTLSQLGMVRHWTRLLRDPDNRADRHRMRGNRAINAVGFVLTGSVLVIVLVTKFAHGAWIVCVAIPVLFAMMYAIHRHYGTVERRMRIDPHPKVTLPSRVKVIVLVARLDAQTLRALRFAVSQRPTSVEAVHIDIAGDGARALAAEWDRRGIEVPLRLVASPYRELVRPVVEYLESIRRDSPRDLILVYVPSYRPTHWWENLLHNQTALLLRSRLMDMPGVMVASVPQIAASESGPGQGRVEDLHRARRR